MINKKLNREKTADSDSHRAEQIDLPIKKQCTWVENGIRCKNKGTHQEPGSLINLCNKHHKELNDSIKDLFK